MTHLTQPTPAATMTAHTRLALYLQRHVYKRGQYQGDAPADKSRRAKSHFRVVKGNGGQMIVRFHSTDILTAYANANGNVILNSGGYHESPTTREAFNHATNVFASHLRYMHSLNLNGHSQTVLGPLRFYDGMEFDGMEFDGEGKLLTLEQPLQTRRINRTESREFTQAIKDSGFKDMFRILAASTVLPNLVTPATYISERNYKNIITDPERAELWPTIIVRTGRSWDKLMKVCKRDMYELVDVPTTGA